MAPDENELNENEIWKRARELHTEQPIDSTNSLVKQSIWINLTQEKKRKKKILKSDLSEPVVKESEAAHISMVIMVKSKLN